MSASFPSSPSSAPSPSSCTPCATSCTPQVRPLPLPSILRGACCYPTCIATRWLAVPDQAPLTHAVPGPARAASAACRRWLSGVRVRAAAFCERLLEKFGTRLMGPIAILRNWTFCLFYVMAELWGSVVVSLLFWGFANQARLAALSARHTPAASPTGPCPAASCTQQAASPAPCCGWQEQRRAWCMARPVTRVAACCRS